MVNSARRAKRRRLAQELEAQRREGSRSAHQMDPADLSGPGTDQEGDEDQEILFAPRIERVEEPRQYRQQQTVRSLPWSKH